MMRLALVAAALTLVVGATATGAASSRPVTTRSGRLTGTTTIQWRGTAGINLAVARRALLDDSDADLVVDGGTYAFVRIVGKPNPGCDASVGRYCGATSISFVRGLHDPPFGGVRSRSHWTIAPDPPVLDAPQVGLYLFTDGLATLTLRTDLTGATSYIASGRIRGRAMPLPRTCVPLDCASSPMDSNRMTYGGAAFDLGPKPGWAEMVGFSANADSRSPDNQVHGINGCLFPNPLGRNLSPDPNDHAYGCGLVPEDEAQARALLIGEVNGHPSFGSAVGTRLHWTEATGRQYVGYRTKSAGTVAARAYTYGVWFAIGIA